jgi:hypothetical protein
MEQERIVSNLNDIKDILESNLTKANEMWDNKEQCAKVVGYLEGTLYSVLSKIEYLTKVLNQ